MKVYLVLHRWSDDEEDGCEITDAYADFGVAVKVMHEAAEAEKQKVKADFDKEFDQDFCEECDELVTFGWYGQALHCDCTWSWSVEGREVL